MTKNQEKEEFLKQYVLNRALSCRDSLSGSGAASEATSAWYAIQREMARNP